MPTDIKRKKNYGYAYINFIEPLDIIYFYYKFNGKRWANTNSIKICEILFSKIQGNKINIFQLKIYILIQMLMKMKIIN